ncbi:MAG: phage tail tape measure protein [Lachnospiraceae bacterium]|nr:phage tail tape measure protein [Lachnospiraceae bacterium]
MNDETYNQSQASDQEYHSLQTELKALTEHFMPDGAMGKSLELFEEMSQKAFQLDSSLLRLSQTLGLSAKELEKVTEESFRMGDALGRTGTEVLAAINQAGQAGYGVSDAMKLASESLKAANLSGGIADADAAMEHLDHILSSFGKDSSYAASINDALAGAAASSESNFGSLLTSASLLSDSAAQAGMSFEELVGILAGAQSLIGNLETKAGSMPDLFATLQKSYGAGVNVYDILGELNQTWNTLEPDSKETFSLSIAGGGQTQLFSDIMEHWADITEASNAASDSLGSADQANAACLDSLEGKTALFQNRMEALSSTLLDSELLDFFLEIGTTGANALNAITHTLQPLNTMAAATGAYLSTKNLGRANHHSRPLEYAEPCMFCPDTGFFTGDREIHG